MIDDHMRTLIYCIELSHAPGTPWQWPVVESVNGKPLAVCNNQRPSLFRSLPLPTTGPRPVCLSCRKVVRVSLLQVHALAPPLTVPSLQCHEANDRSLYPWPHHTGGWRSQFFAIRRGRFCYMRGRMGLGTILPVPRGL